MHGVNLHISTTNCILRREPHASCALTRGIVGYQQGWLCWDKLLEARGAFTHSVSKPPEIILW
jgi:hypothetical protein